MVFVVLHLKLLGNHLQLILPFVYFCTDTFCCIEVDSFGHFFMKAKTNRIKKSMEPNWNEVTKTISFVSFIHSFIHSLHFVSGFYLVSILGTSRLAPLLESWFQFIHSFRLFL